MKRYRRLLLLSIAFTALAACSGGSSSLERSALPFDSSPDRQHTKPALTPIQHVVIVIQENRTVDNLFQFLPGANTQSHGLNPRKHHIKLKAISMTAAYDLSHVHGYWLREYHAGKMDGFEAEQCRGACPHHAAFGYVPQSEVQPYYTLAETYAFADEFFQTNQGPSFPGHQYLVSGSAAVADGSSYISINNPIQPEGGTTGGCDSPSGSTTRLIDIGGHRNSFAYPCFQRSSLMNELDAAGLSWRYYQAKPGPGLWNAVDAIQSIWSNKTEYNANVISPSAQVLTDIANGQLADVTWITPTARASDHSGVTDGSGPSWVASIVNAIGQSPYWSNTAIFVTWDDWGGWYDHVPPKVFNPYELGFRVPLLVISPYAKTGYVSHVPYEFGSILKTTEEIFGLPSLGTTDARSSDLMDCFDFGSVRPHFKPIPTKFPPSHFFRLPAQEID